jgi:hypothetical protein
MKKLLLISAMLFATGCELKIPVDYNQVSKKAEVELSTETVGVKDALKEVSKSDCLDVYRNFKGFANYIRISQKSNTGDLFKKLTEVQEDLGWSRGKLSALTDFTSKNIFKQSFVKEDKGKIAVENLTTDVRAKWAKLFDDYAEGAKLAYLEKK